ncbi:MAG: spermidine/putrescine ABC transporter permease [Chloroflexi bacterium UTCFX4]|nr:MAG: spermidine/putrescine ABC transporter permease [Chloroflexi bacterium UTCFX4]
MKRSTFWGLFWVTLAALYLFLPLWGAFDFSLRAERDVIGFASYTRAFADDDFWRTFTFSNQMAFVSIIVSVLLIVPTAYWVQLKLPHLRPVVEFITLLPFVIPAIILVFGYIKLYSSPLELGPLTIFPALTNTDLSTNVLLIAGYVVLALPYMYRSVDNGLRAIDVRTLTEAAQSLGAGWFTIMFRIIMPNLRAALLSGALLTFAIVVGELTLATFLGRPAFGPYLQQLGQHKAYEPAALSIVSFLLTWLAMILIYFVTRGSNAQVTGAH